MTTRLSAPPNRPIPPALRFATDRPSCGGSFCTRSRASAAEPHRSSRAMRSAHSSASAPRSGNTISSLRRSSSAAARSVSVAIALDGEPPEPERDALAAFAVATRMLDTERALVAARRQRRDSQLLSMVNERLHKSLDRRDVLFGIVEGVRAAFSADRCFVYERMAEGDRATVVAAAVKGSVGTSLRRRSRSTRTCAKCSAA